MLLMNKDILIDELFKRVLLSDTNLPAEEKRRSLSTEVAGTVRI